MIFNPEQADSAGILIDGFPRTALQVDFLKLLYDRLMELHLKHADTPDEWRYPRPSFKVLFSPPARAIGLLTYDSWRRKCRSRSAIEAHLPF